MAAVAVTTDFVDQYLDHVRVRLDGIDWIFFPGQVILKGLDDTDYFRIIDINIFMDSVVAILMPIEYYGLGTLMHQTLESTESEGSQVDYFYIGESEFCLPVNNPTSLNPSTNTNKQKMDLMIAYPPERSDEITLNYAVEYRGTTRNILEIFRSYENQIYCLLVVDGKYKFWELRAPSGMFGRLVRRDNANPNPKSDDVFDEFLSRSDNSDASPDNTDERDNAVDDDSNASSEDTARRRPIDSASMRSMRRLADGESLDRRVETLESRIERIERRLGSEDDETGAPDADDADSLPSLSIRF